MICRSDVADACTMVRYSRCSGRSSVSSMSAGQPDDAVHRRPDLVAHVREELALDAARLLRLPARLLELVRLILQARHQVARQADRADHPLAQPLGGPRGHRDVQVGAVQNEQLEHFGGPRDGPMLDEDQFEQEQGVQPDREMRERERAPEVGVGLIRGADEEQKEQPALVGAGEIDREDEGDHVQRQEHRPEVDALHPLEKGVEHGPGDEAVGQHNRREDPRPRARVAGHERMPQHDEQGDQREPQQTQTGNLDDLEVAFAPLFLQVALVGVGVEEVGHGITLGYRRESAAHDARRRSRLTAVFMLSEHSVGDMERVQGIAVLLPVRKIPKKLAGWHETNLGVTSVPDNGLLEVYPNGRFARLSDPGRATRSNSGNPAARITRRGMRRRIALTCERKRAPVTILFAQIRTRRRRLV